MNHLLKRIIERTPLYHPLRNFIIAGKQKRELAEWQERGRPVPPPHIVKQQTLKTYAERFGLKILVETGTYLGDMVEAMKGHFDKIYSIELSKELYEKARARFRGSINIELICGDSAKELGNIARKLDQPTLFWLDGHYSAGATAKGEKNTPVFEELNHILNTSGKRYVVVIDDARCFGTEPDYPSMPDLRKFIESNMPDMDLVVQDDSIRITPRG